MNKIVAPVDFSAISVNAAGFAAHMAKALKRDLLLHHVIQQNVMYGDITLPVGDFDSLQQEAAAALSDLADALELSAGGGITIHTNITIGNPVDVLLQSSKSNTVYAIVMGTNGAGSVERMLLGSTTQTLVREAACPVVVVPKDAQFSGIENIGLASDFHQVEHKTPAPIIQALLNDFHARLHIMHVDGKHERSAVELKKAEQLLEMLFSGQQPFFHYLHSTEVEGSVLNFASENKLDMLIVLPEHHSLFESFYKHDHTSKFIRQSRIPILALKNQKPKD